MDPTHHVPFQVDADHAMRCCSPRGFTGLLKRTFRPAPINPDKPLPKVAPVWFPFYHYVFAVTSPKGPGEMSVFVDGWSGAFAFFNLMELLEPGLPEGEYFPPAIDLEASQRFARKELLDTIMRQRGVQGRKPVPGAVLHHKLIAYPLWIYYYYRKAGIIDIKICDGAVGDQLGLRTRSGVLAAFKAAKAG